MQVPPHAVSGPPQLVPQLEVQQLPVVEHFCGNVQPLPQVPPQPSEPQLFPAQSGVQQAVPKQVEPETQSLGTLQVAGQSLPLHKKAPHEVIVGAEQPPAPSQPA